MPLVYRLEKGAPLTVEEVDGNFRDLEERLTVLEARTSTDEGIERITVEEGAMVIHAGHGRTWGPFALPRFVPHYWREWEAGSAYGLGDWLSHGGHLYLCIHTHVGRDFTADGAHWRKLGG
jgi:hypothetical protein